MSTASRSGKTPVPRRGARWPRGSPSEWWRVPRVLSGATGLVSTTERSSTHSPRCTRSRTASRRRPCSRRRANSRRTRSGRTSRAPIRTHSASWQMSRRSSRSSRWGIRPRRLSPSRPRPARRLRARSGSSDPIAFPWASVIRLNHHKALNAALADYYFWWTRRLYSYGMDSGSENTLTMARLAAKAALSEINEIAALLVHQYSHIKGGSWEDREPVGSCVNCCHYLSHQTFLSQVLAETATPFPMVWRDHVTSATEVSSRSGDSGAFRSFRFLLV